MKIINTALCSFGMSGRVFHAPFISIHPGFNLYGVWERSKKQAVEKYPDVVTYRSIEQLLNDSFIDLVVVNTPNYTHYQYAKKALESNKHVIIEKPFAITGDECQELIQLAIAKNRKLSVFQNRRYDSDFKTVKKILQQQLLGELVEAEIHYDRYKKELSPKIHKEIPGPGTGALYDLGAHLIDQALQLFGSPEAVFADIRIVRPTSRVDDYFDLLLYYSTFRVRLKSNYLVRESLPGFILHGRKGSFIKPRTDIQESMLQAGMIPSINGWGAEPLSEQGLLHAEIDGKVVKEYIHSECGNYGEYYEGIYEAIINDGRLPVTPEEGMEIITIINASFKSNHDKKLVYL